MKIMEMIVTALLLAALGVFSLGGLLPGYGNTPADQPADQQYTQEYYVNPNGGETETAEFPG